MMDSAIPAHSSVGILETSLADHMHSAAMGTKMHTPNLVYGFRRRTR
jgi:hypothetical protein